MFTNGQILFAIIFFIAFVIAITFAYRKDKKSNIVFFKDSYKVLLFVLLIFFALYGIVKLKHYLAP